MFQQVVKIVTLLSVNVMHQNARLILRFGHGGVRWASCEGGTVGSLLPVQLARAHRRQQHSQTTAKSQFSPLLLGGTTGEKLYTIKHIRKKLRVRDEDTKSNFFEWLRRCAGPTVYGTPSEKVALAEDIFKAIVVQDLARPGVQLFGLLLRAYIYNNSKLSYSNFLARMSAFRCKPNMDTFNLLIQSCCNEGDVGVASKIVAYMKEVDLPVSDTMHAHFIIGHSRGGDLAAAEQVFHRLKARDCLAIEEAHVCLLRAYAERGMIEQTMEILQEIKKDDLTNLNSCYLSVMTALALFNHDKHLPKFLSLQDWLLSDIQSLCYTSISHGKIDAAFVFLNYLSARACQIPEKIVFLFLQAALGQGRSMKDVLQKLNDTTFAPMLPRLAVASVVFIHTYDGYERQADIFPHKGGLEPHPLGDRWVTEMKDALRYYTDHNKMCSTSYFFPLLARLCSDGNVDELLKISRLMLVGGALRNHPVVKMYISTTFANAGTTMEEYMKSKLERADTDLVWFQRLLLLQLGHCMYAEADSTLELAKERLGDNMTALFNRQDVALMLKNVRTTDDLAVNLAYTLMKPGAPLKLFYSCVFVDGDINTTFLTRLARKGLNIACIDIIKIYSNVLSFSKHHSSKVAMKMLDFANSEGHTLSPDESSFFFQYFVIKRCKGVFSPQTFYDSLPKEKKNDFFVRCYRVVHLLQEKFHSMALQEFSDILKIDSQESIPYATWASVLTVGCNTDPRLGLTYLREMKARHHRMKEEVIRSMMRSMIAQEDVESAEALLKEVEAFNFSVAPFERMILPLWVKRGEVERIEALADSGMEETWQYNIKQAKAVALACRGEVDLALQTMETMEAAFKDREYLCILLKYLVTHGHPLQVWQQRLSFSPSEMLRWNTVLFFAYIDCGDLDLAEEMYKEHWMAFDCDEYDMRMRSSQAHVYQEFLKKMNTSLSEEQSDIPDVDAFYETIADVDKRGKGELDKTA